MKKLTMEHSIPALKRYDQAQAEIDRLLDEAIASRGCVDFTNELVDCFEVPITHLQEAFWKDTKDRNSRDNCRHVDAFFVRRMVKEVT